MQIVDIRFKQIDLPTDSRVIADVYSRMRAQRQQVASRLRAEGEEQANQIKAKADRDRAVILAEAERDAQTLRGQGDAEASTDYLADMSGYDFTMALDDDNTMAAGQDFTR